MFYKLFSIFPFIVSTNQVQFKGEITCFCIYFSFPLCAFIVIVTCFVRKVVSCDEPLRMSFMQE